jgi:hypothetical protein
VGDHKKKRDKYRKLLERPDGQFRAKVLLVGEAPPGGGNLFFDMKGHVFFNIARAAGFDPGPKSRKRTDDMLKEMITKGLFVEDLLDDPIRKGGKQREKGSSRKRKYEAGALKLKKTFRRYDPKYLRAIVIFVRDVQLYVQEARDNAGLHEIPTWVLPFPRAGNAKVFKEKLQWILQVYGLGR